MHACTLRACKLRASVHVTCVQACANDACVRVRECVRVSACVRVRECVRACMRALLSAIGARACALAWVVLRVHQRAPVRLVRAGDAQRTKCYAETVASRVSDELCSERCAFGMGTGSDGRGVSGSAALSSSASYAAHISVTSSYCFEYLSTANLPPI